jgi:hypothetical protein
MGKFEIYKEMNFYNNKDYKIMSMKERYETMKLISLYKKYLKGLKKLIGSHTKENYPRIPQDILESMEERNSERIYHKECQIEELKNKLRLDINKEIISLTIEIKKNINEIELGECD